MAFLANLTWPWAQTLDQWTSTFFVQSTPARILLQNCSSLIISVLAKILFQSENIQTLKK